MATLSGRRGVVGGGTPNKCVCLLAGCRRGRGWFIVRFVLKWSMEEAGAGLGQQGPAVSSARKKNLNTSSLPPGSGTTAPRQGTMRCYTYTYTVYSPWEDMHICTFSVPWRGVQITRNKCTRGLVTTITCIVIAPLNTRHGSCRYEIDSKPIVLWCGSCGGIEICIH